MPKSKGPRYKRRRDAGGKPPGSRDDRRLLREAIFEVVENQIRDRDPPETQATFDRLLRQGFTEEEAMRLIGCVVSSEMFHILREGKPFDLSRYVAMLDALPRLPWDEE